MKVSIGLIIAVLLVGVGLFVGYELFARRPGPTVTSQSVVLALEEQGFLVTQTFTTTQDATIDQSTGSVWKDFFWGQDITAHATLRVSAGVDLRKVKPSDVVVDSRSIHVLLPPIQTQSVEIVGDITLQNHQGVLKRIFDNNDGYNIASNELRAAALRAAIAPDIIRQAQENTLKQVARTLELLDKTKSISVEFKNN